MKTFFAILRIRFQQGVQYRVVVFSHLFTGFVWGLMLVLAYAAFYRSDPAAFPMTLPETVSYMWLQQTFLILFSVVHSDNEIEMAIETGSIAYELVRPADLYMRWYARAYAGRAIATVLRLPLLLVTLFLPAPYTLMLPPDMFQFAAFLVSGLLASGVTVACAMFMYVIMFYITSYRGVRVLFIAATGLLAGTTIPFPFFPEPVQRVLEALPFAAMQNMPLRIYSGNIGGMDALRGILFQIFWLAVLLIGGQRAMRRATKKVVVQGG